MKDVSRIVLVVATFSLLMLCAYVGVYRLAEKGQLATILSLRSLDSIDPVSLRSNPIVKMVVMTPQGPGELRIVLHKDWAPLGVQRFVELVDQNFYDDCRFFRVLKVSERLLFVSRVLTCLDLIGLEIVFCRASRHQR